MTGKTNKEKPRRQCAKCPWRVDVDPNDIPNGYCEIKHANLSSTIASGDVMSQLAEERGMRIMSCHESDVGDEKHCIGWMHNQLGPGNNIRLRLRVAFGHIEGAYDLVGEQHETLGETLPR